MLLIARPGGVEAFDEALYLNFTILAYSDVVDTTGDYLWDQFQPIFGRVGDMFTYLPVFQTYFRSMFSKLLDDGIYRWEIRTSLNSVYDGNKTYTQLEIMALILDEYEAWQQEDMENRQDFSIGIILQGIRDQSIELVTEALVSAYEIRSVYPDYLIGFDLVGHEDPGETLYYWAPILLDVEAELLSKNSSWTKMPFFFHAGESNRYPVQENLVDAVFLNTSRIGHGFGLQEFPALWHHLNIQGICVEACPISNQVLGLVVDLRNHPVGQLLHHALPPAHPSTNAAAKGVDKIRELLDYDPSLSSVLQHMTGSHSLAVSINNDDPGFWGIDALVSYDWYAAVLAWDLNVAAMKQLAVDSIVHMGGHKRQKAKVLKRWHKDWHNWINRLSAIDQ